MRARACACALATDGLNSLRRTRRTQGASACLPLLTHSHCGSHRAVTLHSQTWTLAKRLERFFKVTLWCRCGPSAAGMSVVEPAQYARRFLKMIDRILDLGGPVPL